MYSVAWPGCACGNGVEELVSSAYEALVEAKETVSEASGRGIKCSFGLGGTSSGPGVGGCCCDIIPSWCSASSGVGSMRLIRSKRPSSGKLWYSPSPEALPPRRPALLIPSMANFFKSSRPKEAGGA